MLWEILEARDSARVNRINMGHAAGGRSMEGTVTDLGDDDDWASFWSFCGYDLLDLSLGETGFVSSPNHPAKYGPNRRCLWNLQVRTIRYIQGHPTGCRKEMEIN